MKRIQQYVAAHDTETHQRARDEEIAVRSALHSELRGMAEYVNVNGRLHRYGFVSRDNDRTRNMVKQMFDSPESFVDAVGFPIKEWDDIDSVRLKLHLQSSRDNLTSLLPAPLLELNPDTLSWLKGVYVSLHRLNDHWGTRFTSWDNIVIDADATRDVTKDDIETVRKLLLDLTSRVLTQLPSPGTFNFDPPKIPGHGVVETIFACIACERDVRDTYMLMLRYLAQTSRDDTFTPLPPGKHSLDKSHIQSFIDDFYITEDELVRDWGTTPPIHQIPATTTPSVVEFETLVSRVCKDEVSSHDNE
jgi:hypothetical protein